MISDKRMSELIRRAKQAATISTGGGDGSLYRERFSEEVYKATLATLVDLELRGASVVKSPPPVDNKP